MSVAWRAEPDRARGRASPGTGPHVSGLFWIYILKEKNVLGLRGKGCGLRFPITGKYVFFPGSESATTSVLHLSAATVVFNPVVAGTIQTLFFFFGTTKSLVFTL